MKTFNIPPVDRSMQTAIQEKIDNLNKPKGSLGRLEELAMQVSLVQQTLTPSLAHPCHLLFGGDHGIEREGVSVSPREVTWQQMLNFTRGGGAVNMFCRQHGFKLRVVDVGVDYDFFIDHSPLTIDHCSAAESAANNGQRSMVNGQRSMVNGQRSTVNGQRSTVNGQRSMVNGQWSTVNGQSIEFLDRKIARGTRNFLYEPAMTDEEFDRALCVGIGSVDACAAEDCRILSIGEMGIGNTSPSSIWMHLLGGIPLSECIGAGAGLDTPGIRHKYDVLSRAVAHFSLFTNHSSLDEVLRYFGGFEMIAAIGAMLRAAELHIIILIDGFIMTACAIAAIKLHPAVQDYMIFTHCGDESGHKKMLGIVDAKPLLSLGLRLGEGTGALCAFPIVDSAVRMMNEMNNFRDAKITKYF